MGREAHEDPRRRYVAAVFAGIFYLIVGSSGHRGGHLPRVPGRAGGRDRGARPLPRSATGSLSAVGSENQREPALVTFLVTASGIAPAGIGSAFWDWWRE